MGRHLRAVWSAVGDRTGTGHPRIRPRRPCPLARARTRLLPVSQPELGVPEQAVTRGHRGLQPDDAGALLRGVSDDPRDPGTQWISWVHIDDWLAILRTALEPGSALEGVLHATGPEPTRNADLMAALRRSVGRPRGAADTGPARTPRRSAVAHRPGPRAYRPARCSRSSS